MVIINTKTNIVHENANFKQVGILIGKSSRTISRWARRYKDVKQYKYWRLYFKVIKLKRGVLTEEW